MISRDASMRRRLWSGFRSEIPVPFRARDPATRVHRDRAFTSACDLRTVTVLGLPHVGDDAFTGPWQFTDINPNPRRLNRARFTFIIIFCCSLCYSFLIVIVCLWKGIGNPRKIKKTLFSINSIEHSLKEHTPLMDTEIHVLLSTSKTAFDASELLWRESKYCANDRKELRLFVVQRNS
jgi:hypothetical protein